jgi:Uma2 family endonuclease
MSDSLQHLPSKDGEPAWEVALFYPRQGGWTEADYFELNSGPLVEYDDGCIEVLDLPTKEHQRIVQYLLFLLAGYVRERNLGEVFVAPLPIRLWPRKYREPDVVYLAEGRSETDGYSNGADLVMEVLSPGVENRRRDLVTKRDDYAQAGVAEYWIVDPEEKRITVLSLDGNQYTLYGNFTETETARSKSLPDFTVQVAKALAR